MKWLRKVFGKETEQRDFTQLLVDSITNAAGEGSSILKTATLEIALGIWSRAFASAEVQPVNPSTAGLTRRMLSQAARELILTGESLWHPYMDMDRIMLQPISGYDIQGGWQPKDWRYEIDLAGPTTMTRIKAASSEVIHLRYQQTANEPWRGQSPLGNMSNSTCLLELTEREMTEEFSAPVGTIMPVPLNPDDRSLGDIKTAFANLRGRMLLLETQRNNWHLGGQGAGADDWVPRKFGTDVPATNLALRAQMSIDILQALGIPNDLVTPGTNEGAREAWRRFLHGSLIPLGRKMSEELSEKLETDISFKWSEIAASDVAGRARAFASMTTGGLPVRTAAKASGVVDSDEADSLPEESPQPRQPVTE